MTRRSSFNFAVCAVDRHGFGIAAAAVRILGLAWTDFKNSLAQVVFAANLFTADRQKHVADVNACLRHGPSAFHFHHHGPGRHRAESGRTLFRSEKRDANTQVRHVKTFSQRCRRQRAAERAHQVMDALFHIGGAGSRFVLCRNGYGVFWLRLGLTASQQISPDPRANDSYRQRHKNPRLKTPLRLSLSVGRCLLYTRPWRDAGERLVAFLPKQFPHSSNEPYELGVASVAAPSA